MTAIQREILEQLIGLGVNVRRFMVVTIGDSMVRLSKGLSVIDITYNEGTDTYSVGEQGFTGCRFTDDVHFGELPNFFAAADRRSRTSNF